MTTHPERPKRLDRVFQRYDPPLYLVTAVTRNRRPLLDNETAHDAFLAHARRQARINIAVGRYVLMPDHMHLFIRIGAGQSLSQSIKHLKQAITKALRREKPGLDVWQWRFSDHMLRNDESYSEKWAYVRQNPVRAGLVHAPDDWPYQGEIVRMGRV